MTIMCLYNGELLTSLLSVLAHLLILLSTIDIPHAVLVFLLFNIYNGDTVDSLSYIYTYLSINMHSNNFTVFIVTLLYMLFSRA